LALTIVEIHSDLSSNSSWDTKASPLIVLGALQIVSRHGSYDVKLQHKQNE